MNLAFSQKLIAEELMDTIFFSSGIRAEKSRVQDSVELSTPSLKVVIKTYNSIQVGKNNCRSTDMAKKVIMHMFN